MATAVADPDTQFGLPLSMQIFRIVVIISFNWENYVENLLEKIPEITGGKKHVKIM